MGVHARGRAARGAAGGRGWRAAARAASARAAARALGQLVRRASARRAAGRGRGRARVRTPVCAPGLNRCARTVLPSMAARPGGHPPRHRAEQRSGAGVNARMPGRASAAEQRSGAGVHARMTGRAAAAGGAGRAWRRRWCTATSCATRRAASAPATWPGAARPRPVRASCCGPRASVQTEALQARKVTGPDQRPQQAIIAALRQVCCSACHRRSANL
jgi:hypothetical protein